jgi:ketosteroid isomerase-like protein
MTQDCIAERDIRDLVERAAKANDALLCGDIGGYLALIKHAEDYTLMAPFGGAPTHGFDRSGDRVAALARFFKSGTADLELVRAYASGDMVVLAVVERQRAEIGGLPEQDWSLRVTLVFRRQGNEWQLAHRHADPLVKGISLEQAAALARG